MTSNALQLLVQIADLYFAVQTVLEHVRDRDEINADLKRLEGIYIRARDRSLTQKEQEALQQLLEKYENARRQAYQDYLNI